MFLEFVRKKYDFPEFKEEKKFKALISNPSIPQPLFPSQETGKKILLVKPTTFMNLSWEALIEITNFYKIDKKDIIVISDDKDMEFWKIRFRETWSAWWHNGLKSIIKHFWENFKRIKIWVWNNKNYETSDWVLSKFSDEELKKLEEVFEKSLKLLIEKI